MSDTLAPQTIVTVPYNQWIGYNILKYMASMPIGSSVVVAGFVAYVTRKKETETETPMRDTINAFVITFLIMYAILWYYGSTLFV